MLYDSHFNLRARKNGKFIFIETLNLESENENLRKVQAQFIFFLFSHEEEKTLRLSENHKKNRKKAFTLFRLTFYELSYTKMLRNKIP